MSDETSIREITLTNNINFLVYQHRMSETGKVVRFLHRNDLFGRNRRHFYKMPFNKNAERLNVVPLTFSDTDIDVIREVARDFAMCMPWERYRHNPVPIFNKHLVFYEARDMLSVLRQMKNFDPAAADELEEKVFEIELPERPSRKRARDEEDSSPPVDHWVTHNNPIVEATYEDEGLTRVELCFLEERFKENGKKMCRVSPYSLPGIAFVLDAKKVTVPKRKKLYETPRCMKSALVSDGTYSYNKVKIVEVRKSKREAVVEYAPEKRATICFDELFQ